MSTAETIAQIKDIVVILFLGFASLIIVFGAILGLRLYWRVGRFMDRMERFTDGFETAFGSITTARKALGPVMRGLDFLGVTRGFGRRSGRGRADRDEEKD